MEYNLVDRETLGRFIDKLITTKYPGHPAEIFSTERETLYRKVNDCISDAVFGNLSHDELTKLNAMLDNDESDPDAFRDFFNNINFDLKQTITDALDKFRNEYIGGAYAD